jgi:uncharacterized protein (DUF983 family)
MCRFAVQICSMTIFRQSPAQASQEPARNVLLSLKRGWRQTCPSCGKGALYYKYLKVNDRCPVCREELHHHRADDAPPYFTMLITAHLIVGGIVLLEKTIAPPTWVELAIWMPALVVLSLWLLPRIKGALIGYQWANRMHGFGVGDVEGVDSAPTIPTADRA